MSGFRRKASLPYRLILGSRLWPWWPFLIQMISQDLEGLPQGFSEELCAESSDEVLVESPDEVLVGVSSGMLVGLSTRVLVESSDEVLVGLSSRVLVEPSA